MAWVWIFIVAITGLLTILVDTGTPQSLVDNSAQIVRTLNELRQIKVEVFDPDVPSAAIVRLASLKRQVRELVNNTLNNEKKGDAIVVQQTVINLLREKGVSITEDDSQDYTVPKEYLQPYGHIESIIIEKPTNQADIVVARMTVSIMCSSDTALWIFRRTATGWKLIFKDQVDDYTSIDSAYGSYSYKIIPGHKGRLYVVAVHISPWCTSFWHKILYMVYELTLDQEGSRILLNKSDTIYLGMEPPTYTLTSTANSFELSYYGGEKYHPDYPIPKITRVYDIKNNKVIERKQRKQRK